MNDLEWLARNVDRPHTVSAFTYVFLCERPSLDYSWATSSNPDGYSGFESRGYTWAEVKQKREELGLDKITLRAGGCMENATNAQPPAQVIKVDDVWSGEGLPPVGTVCEIAASTQYLTIRYPEGTKVKIYSNFTDDRGAEMAAFVDPIGKVGGVATARCFRPIKTERERVIEAAAKALQEHDSDVTELVTNVSRFAEAAAALYDKGLLKGSEE